MKDNFMAIIAIIALILSVIAITLEVSYQISEIEPSKIKGVAWTSDNDGSLSGLDADKIDDLDSDQFIRNDQSGILHGDLSVEGNITHNIATRYYTIPASSFKSFRYDIAYISTHDELYNIDPLYRGYNFIAPFYLPDGAIITKLTVRYIIKDPQASLNIALRKSGEHTRWIYGELLPNETINEYQLFETDFINETVTNKYNSYVIEALIDPYQDSDDVILNFVTIEYKVTNSLP